MMLLLASIHWSSSESATGYLPTHSFVVAIAAHNEEAVIVDTVQRLLELDYPSELYSVHVVADHCSDRTAEAARRAGAIVHERNEGPRSGKGAALSWLFQRVLSGQACDAVAVFDADTRVDGNFLRAMDARLLKGDQIIQGQHIIRNPRDGWFPALTWAMFLIDNRLQNLGRTNLGCSAKNMGDSICLRADVLRKVGWEQGLADDYQLRQKSLLNGIKIAYEPAAIGYGEAPLTWAQAWPQRTRWVRGVNDANRQFAWQLLIKGIKTKNAAMLDAALQAYLPSYSTLTIITLSFVLLHVIAYKAFGAVVPDLLITAWAALLAVIAFYPIIGLALAKAPARAYLAILTGPFFVVWKTCLVVAGRLRRNETIWVRTSHKG